MAPGTLLQRNIRPSLARHQSDDESEFDDGKPVNYNSHEYGHIENEDTKEPLSGSEDETSSELQEEGDEEVHGAVMDTMNAISFGALLEAQEALSRKRKRGSDTTAQQEAKLDGIRSRLREIRSQQERESGSGALRPKRKELAGSAATKSTNGPHRCAESVVSDQDDEDSDSAPSEEGATVKSRTSKHAPASQSSKRQVTRKRNVIDVPKRAYRDPRFDALHQSQTQPGHSEKAYGFLRDYQKDEIAELKSGIKLTRNEEDKETLRRKLVSMENQFKSKDTRDRTQEVIRQHRKDEREKVEQGKRPYFLKKSELKERVLVEKFKGMKSKDREKLMEKRKRKESQKEMKRMPNARRVTG